MKSMAALISAGLLTGCASSNMVPIEVESSPPGARIDVNGAAFGTTPTTIELGCNKRWVGVMSAPDGWAYSGAYQVTAYPASGQEGLSQTKTINPCQIQTKPGHMHFDLGLDAVSPRQRVDVNVTTIEKSSVSDTLMALKKLRDQGVLSEQEYRQKVDQALSAP